jgi:hypothetical protein
LPEKGTKCGSLIIDGDGSKVHDQIKINFAQQKKKG